MAARPSDFPSAIDLCAGCGGFSLGAQNVGANVRAAFEINPAAYYTYKTHIADHDDMHLVSRDITTLDPKHISEEIDAVFAGPPCQPFSDAQGDPFDGDPEDTVLFAVSEWIEELEPAVFAIENVGGLKRNHPDVMARLLDALRDAEYNVSPVALDAANYGVPQKRERVFILGVRADIEPPGQWEPEHTRTPHAGQATLSSLDVPRDGYRTAGDALSDLPEPLPAQKPVEDPVHLTPHFDDNRVLPDSCPTWVVQNDDGTYSLGPHGGIRGDISMPPNHVEADHSLETREKYAEWELGYCGGRTTDRRLHPDEPSPTITVSQGTPPVHYVGKSPSHPERPVENVRRLTPREVARIQTFPDSWCFAGTRLEQYRQVGNAVPPLLASHVVDHLFRTAAETLGCEGLYADMDSNEETKEAASQREADAEVAGDADVNASASAEGDLKAFQ